MSQAVFVSDLHISSPQDPKCLGFLRFLDACADRRVTDLFLLGDVFDLWISDRRYFVARYREVIEKLRHLRHLGVKIHYFEGNHDLDLRPFWQHELGLDVHSEAAHFEIEGRRLRLEHGDQMDPNDRGYIFLRWLMRTPLLIFLQRNLPDAVVRWVGERASRTSRAYTSQLKTHTREHSRRVMEQHMLRVLDQAPFDIFVCGHVHCVEDFSVRGVRCVNLGTWLDRAHIFYITSNAAQLLPLEDWLRSNS